MSWSDHYARRDAIDAVLDRAAADPTGVLPFDEVPGVAEIFTDRTDLLLAVHYRWLLRLTGRIGVALTENDDSVDAVSKAWRTTAAAYPVLRAVLDTHGDAPALRVAHDGELRLLALSAGLGTAGETAQELTRIGAAYLALIRTAPEREPDRRRNPVEQLLRRLVASA